MDICPYPAYRFFETLHTALFWVYLYQMTITYFGDQEKLRDGHWSVNYSIGVHGIISAMVQVNALIVR